MILPPMLLLIHHRLYVISFLFPMQLPIQLQPRRKLISQLGIRIDKTWPVKEFCMKPSEDALNLLREFEQGPQGGFASKPYRCPSGKLTIGWGHVIKPNEKLNRLSAEQADELLQRDLQEFAQHLNDFIAVKVTQSMFDALCCFAFNVGIGAAVGSTLMADLNKGNYQNAADEFARWDKGTNPVTKKKEVLSGLVTRRKAEYDLFLKYGLL